jgi:citrate/tricarballylate utilization protein
MPITDIIAAARAEVTQDVRRDAYADTRREAYSDARREAYSDARRAMEVCNACRYCEGYCAVFPAMELRRAFTDGDLAYLANLCHGCRGCFHACQYAPPHPWGINVPKALATLRQESYAEHAWPAPLARAFRRNGLFVSLVTTLVLVLVLAGAAAFNGAALGRSWHGPGGFYAVVPLWVITVLAFATLGFSAVALVKGWQGFARASGTGAPPAGPRAWLRALHDAASLRNLGGGGHGCNDVDERFSTTRRSLHHAMAYGFLLCLAATSVGTVYHHLLGWIAPYGPLSLPVLLGTAGGIGIVIGTAGLMVLKVIENREPVARHLMGGEFALLAQLMLIALTGLALLLLRATPAMGMLLAVHLGLVLGFFALLPYGKFVHAGYRLAALARAAAERGPA